MSSSAAAEGSFTALTGLLEVEPLHFTCISTSDGTRVERDDASMFTGTSCSISTKLLFNIEILVLSFVLVIVQPVSTFGVTPAVGGLSTGTVGEASTALSSAAQVALQSLSHAMVSAEQQLQVLQEKQQQLLKLQQQVRFPSHLLLYQDTTFVVQAELLLCLHVESLNIPVLAESRKQSWRPSSIRPPLQLLLLLLESDPFITLCLQTPLLRASSFTPQMSSLQLLKPRPSS